MAVSLFELLQHVLRLATQCPPGAAGDEIRRAACELIEADTGAAQDHGRRRMLKVVTGVESRRSRGVSRADDPGPVIVSSLIDALQRELRSG
jgi:hypothetical protein